MCEAVPECFYGSLCSQKIRRLECFCGEWNVSGTVQSDCHCKVCVHSLHHQLNWQDSIEGSLVLLLTQCDPHKVGPVTHTPSPVKQDTYTQTFSGLIREAGVPCTTSGVISAQIADKDIGTVFTKAAHLSKNADCPLLGGYKGKWVFVAKRWEEMRKVGLILYQ